MDNDPSILKLQEGNFLAYHKTDGANDKPGVVFLGGFMSDMQGTKAMALERRCKTKGYDFVRFDYIGHGQSSGEFTDGTIGIWKDNALQVLDKLTDGPQILIGSSMGGWLMLLAALERRDRIAAIIGIASAPDFTEDLIWKEMDEDTQKELMEKGVYNLESDYGDDPYSITKELIEEGRNHLLLGGNININCPVRLIHGVLDEDVPSHLSIMLSQQLMTGNICVNLVEGGDHRMSTPANIELLCETLEDLMKNF